MPALGSILHIRNALLIFFLGRVPLVGNLSVLSVFRWEGHLNLSTLAAHPWPLPGGGGWSGRFARIVVLCLTVFPIRTLASAAVNVLSVPLVYCGIAQAIKKKWAAYTLAALVVSAIDIAVFLFFSRSFFLFERGFREPGFAGRINWGEVVEFISVGTLVLCLLLVVVAWLGYLGLRLATTLLFRGRLPE